MLTYVKPTRMSSETMDDPDSASLRELHAFVLGLGRLLALAGAAVSETQERLTAVAAASGAREARVVVPALIIAFGRAGAAARAASACWARSRTRDRFGTAPASMLPSAAIEQSARRASSAREIPSSLRAERRSRWALRSDWGKAKTSDPNSHEFNSHVRPRGLLRQWVRALSTDYCYSI
jgi:hypothetical protein